eukprot:scaffold56259_cov64-Phaeocystis_antarctica.AAC.9
MRTEQRYCVAGCSPERLKVEGLRELGRGAVDLLALGHGDLGLRDRRAVVVGRRPPHEDLGLLALVQRDVHRVHRLARLAGHGVRVRRGRQLGAAVERHALETDLATHLTRAHAAGLALAERVARRHVDPVRDPLRQPWQRVAHLGALPCGVSRCEHRHCSACEGRSVPSAGRREAEATLVAQAPALGDRVTHVAVVGRHLPSQLERRVRYPADLEARRLSGRRPRCVDGAGRRGQRRLAAEPHVEVGALVLLDRVQRPGDLDAAALGGIGAHLHRDRRYVGVVVAGADPQAPRARAQRADRTHAEAVLLGLIFAATELQRPRAGEAAEGGRIVAVGEHLLHLIAQVGEGQSEHARVGGGRDSDLKLLGATRVYHGIGGGGQRCRGQGVGSGLLEDTRHFTHAQGVARAHAKGVIGAWDQVVVQELRRLLRRLDRRRHAIDHEVVCGDGHAVGKGRHPRDEDGGGERQPGERLVLGRRVASHRHGVRCDTRLSRTRQRLVAAVADAVVRVDLQRKVATFGQTAQRGGGEAGGGDADGVALPPTLHVARVHMVGVDGRAVAARPAPARRDGCARHAGGVERPDQIGRRARSRLGDGVARAAAAHGVEGAHREEVAGLWPQPCQRRTLSHRAATGAHLELRHQLLPRCVGVGEPPV